MKFKIEYNYEDLQNSAFDSFQRHIIWRNKYLNIGKEKASKGEREILQRYYISGENNYRMETYEEGVYIKDIKNMVDFQSENYESTQNIEYVASKNDKKSKNQILMVDEED